MKDSITIKLEAKEALAVLRGLSILRRELVENNRPQNNLLQPDIDMIDRMKFRISTDLGTFS